MPKPVTDPIQVAQRPPETSDYPDRISDTTVAFAMCKAVPDVVDEVTDSATLVIKHGSMVVENGMTINPADIPDEPEVIIKDKSNGTFTLMLVDPDAPTPSHPSMRSMLHMCVINIPAHDVARGELLEEYMSPAPSHSRHRYVWLLFRQTGRVIAKKLRSREGFQVKQWAKEHGLAECASGLWFWASSDEE